MALILSVSTNKGGTLKTTTSVNLASVYSLNGKKVLIVDADNQGNVALSFGKNPDDFKNTLYDVLVDNLDPKEAIQNVYQNIDILPSNDDMAFFEFDVLQDRKKFDKPFHLLKNALDKVKDQYDIILIDSPPNIGINTGNVLTAAHQVLIPFQPETYSMRSLVKILKAINDFKKAHNPELEVLGVVGTLVDGRSVLHSAVLQNCRKFCFENDVKMFDTVIPKSIRFANAVGYEKAPAVMVDKKHPIVKSYFNLYEEVIQNG